MGDETSGAVETPLRAGRRAAARVLAGLAIALVAFGQWVLSVAEAFGKSLDGWTCLARLDALLPGVRSLRFPAHAGAAFLALGLAALLFAVACRVARARALDGVRVVPLPEAGLAALRGKWGIALLGVAASAALLTALAAARHANVSPFVWLAGVGALLSAAFLVDRANGLLDAERLRRLRVSALYTGGLVGLVFALAALGSRRWGLLALFGVAGAALLAASLRAGWAGWSGEERRARGALVALMAGSFFLLSWGLRSWPWSFLGDEYEFLETARAIGDGRIPLSDLLSGQGTYGYHPVLSSAYQLLSMTLFGEDAYGWRVSHSILLALCVAAFFSLARRFLGTAAALLGSALLGTAHVLLSVGKLGSNNAQAILFLPLSAALLFGAFEGGLLAGYVGAGLVLGLGFFTFGIAKIWSLLVAVLLVFFAFPFGGPARRGREGFVASAALVLASVAVALPLLLDRSQWSEQSQHTLFSNDAPPRELAAKLARSTLYGLLSPLTNDQPGVFVAGPHADAVTGGLFVLGLAALAAAALGRPAPARRLARVLLLLFGVAVVLLAGIQQYPYPNVTRTFALVVFTALFAAAGFRALVEVLGLSARAAAGLAAVVLAGATLLNAWQTAEVSLRKTPQSWVALLLQTAEISSDAAGRGPKLWSVLPEGSERWPDYLFPIYGVERTRSKRLTVDEALSSAELCERTQSAILVLPHEEMPRRDALLSRMTACWPEASLSLLHDATGAPLLYRMVTPAAKPVLSREVPGVFVEKPVELVRFAAASPGGEPWGLRQARSLAVAPDGRVAAVTFEKEVVVFAADGRPALVLRGLVEPAAFGFLPGGGLVVLDAGVSDCVVWLGREGEVVGRSGQRPGIGSPLGVAVVDDASVWVTDAPHRRVVRVDRADQVLEERRAGGRLRQPTSLALARDGRLAVADPAAELLVVLDASDRVLFEKRLPGGYSVDRAAQVAFLPDGTLLVTDSDAGRVERFDASGARVGAFETISQSVSIAVGGDRVAIGSPVATRLAIVSLAAARGEPGATRPGGLPAP